MRSNFIACELFEYKLAIGYIFVEGLDDVVAIAVGGGAKIVLFVSIGFSESDEVEPVTGPAFTVAWVLEELIDELFVGDCVIAYALQFFGGRWESKKVKVEASCESIQGGVGTDGEIFFGEFLLDECVDGMGVVGRRRLDGFNGLEEPVLAVFGGDRLCSVFGG